MNRPGGGVETLLFILILVLNLSRVRSEWIEETPGGVKVRKRLRRFEIAIRLTSDLK